MVRCSSTASFAAALFAIGCLHGGAAQYDNCTSGAVIDIGNGRCDVDNNNPSCGYDGGDCCECTCADGLFHSCADSDFECVYPDCGDPLDALEVSTCYEDSKGDGKCDEYNNTPACEYDGGDCCECSCAYGSVFDCGLFNVFASGYDCKDPACFDPALVAEFPNCTGDWMAMGDEGCDDENNNSACGYDGGDCCACGCSGTSCQGRSFSCLDPNADLEINECAAPPLPSLPCSVDVQRSWVVESSTEVEALAEVVSCSGGAFEVEWRGTVSVYPIFGPFYVRDGTVLTITGDGSSAVIDGMAATRLFTVVNATLHVSGVNITSGDSLVGGAIAAAGSILTLDRVNFIGNNAVRSGGALHVSDGSIVSCVGGGVFAYNTADINGGAMYVTGNSVVSCGGSWLRNAAGYSAGALMVDGESSVSWSKKTAFRNNRGIKYGGALYVQGGSTVSWNASTVFYSNFGPDFEGGGGAVCAANGSSVSWSGTTIFDSNFAFTNGGALLVTSGSSASWSGITTYVGNALQWGGGEGGAVYVEDGSSASWSANTTYLGNEASLSGGALYASYASVSWAGETEFRDNSAEKGGAVYLIGSSLSWSGNTTLVQNNAGSGGGALHAFDSSVVWSGGATQFANNSATGTIVSSGGALSLFRSEVSWSGATEFVGNTAIVYGGAVYIEESCNVSWTGETKFKSNRVSLEDVGAVATGALAGGCGADSTLVINGTTTFNKNDARLNGGGLAMRGGCALTIGTTADVSFVGNSAGVAGGALFLSVAALGPIFTDASFISNSAAIGGAVSIFGSGNSEDEGGETSPTTFNRCQFIDNQASSTGGAINSAAGQDAIDGSVFAGNSAGTGGALRLAGTASVYNCSFVENISKDGQGPAVSNIGLIESIASTSFSGNGFDCPSGTFLDFNNESGDPFAVACSGCEKVICAGCVFMEGFLAPTCTEVVDHSTSDGGNVTLQALSIDRGYWRATANSPEVLACYNAGACLGGVTGASGYCLEGYEGPYCSICGEGYTEQLGFHCGKCPENSARGIAVAVVLAVVVLAVAAAVVSYLMSGEAGVSRERGAIECVTQYIPLQSVKIVIVAWQILTQFTSVANVTYPDVYQDFLDILDVFNFDIGWLFLSAGCVFDVDFHDRLLISTISPIVVLAFLACTYAAATREHRGAPETIQNIRHKHVSMVLLLTFLVYSSVSSVLFQSFACEKLDDGKNYLRSDYRLECDTAKHKGFQVFAGFMIALYTVGIPALYAILLLGDRNVLREDKEGREEPPRVKSTSDLWKPYKPTAFYYEVIECGRRVLLAGVVVFIYPNTASQIAVTLMIAFAFIIISEVLSPYSSPWDTWISRMGHVVVFASMFVALLLKVDVSDERASSQRVFEAVLVAAHACMVVAVVAEAITLSCSLTCSFCPLRVGRRGDSLPRSRRGLSRQVGGRHPFH